MPSHSDSSYSRAHQLNILSARLGATRKVLTANISINIEGPTAHFYDAGASNRTVTLPALVAGGGTLYFIANVGVANSLNVVNSAAVAVVTIAPGEAAFIVASGLEWVASKSTASALAVFGASGLLHSTGLVPDPGAIAGATRFLREDATWSLPGGGGGGLTDGFAFVTDGTNTATASGSDTFKLRSSDGAVVITVTNNDVTHGDVANFTINEAAVDHDALLNFVANEHIDHSAVSISTAANSGLAGGGTIAATRTLSLDVSNLTADTPVLGDSFAFGDLSGGDTNKATLTTLNSILDHNALVNFVANKHIDHTLVSIATGTGLSGGGDISSTRTLNLDINALSADTIAVGDLLLFYDISGSDHNKITLANLNSSLDHNTLLNYSANQHVDHTTVSISAGGGLTGGGTIAATRTIALDITGQDSAAAATGDEIIYWDISGLDFDKRSFASLITDLSILTTATGQPLDPTLTALAAFNTNGLLAQTAADTFAGRTITGTASQITVVDGSGVAGNPTLSLPADVLIPTVLTVPNTGLHLLDTNASHDLIVKPGSDLTADRTLTITTGDAGVTLNLTAVTDEFVLAYDAVTNTWRGVTPPAAGGRTILTGPLTLNVPADYATRQLAYNALCALYDTAGYTVTIQVANGTYTDQLDMETAWTGGGEVHFVGDPVTPGNVIMNGNAANGNFNINCLLPANLLIDGFKISNSDGGGVGIYHHSVGTVTVGAVEFGSCGFAHMHTGVPGSFLYLSANYKISGGAGYHLSCAYGALAFADSLVVTLTGTPNFSSAFLHAYNTSILYYALMTFVGSATGQRFVVEGLSQIDTSEAGPLYLPGNAKGYVSSGGIYL